MTVSIQLQAVAKPDSSEVHFYAIFPAPPDGADVPCAPARLETGEGEEALELGLLCSPTAYTWHDQHRFHLISHRYQEAGPHTATLYWGDTAATAVVGGPPPPHSPATQPVLSLFTVQPDRAEPMQAAVQLTVQGLATGQRLRVDGGAGQIHRLDGSHDRSEQAARWTLDYPKPGTYTVAVDLVGDDGFWSATLAERALEIPEPMEEPETARQGRPGLPDGTPSEAVDVAEPRAGEQPWLPFRYAQPLWAWIRTYTRPGGDRVSRRLAPGTYLAVRSEAVVGGQLWYQTGSYDWAPAGAVSLLQPSQLRGVELGSPEPEPERPGKRGVVTAHRLNVRARPGISPDNPRIDQLSRGTEVDIYAEQPYAGATWYRIGVDRWVHGDWVRIVQGQPQPEPEPQPEPGEPVRHGVVTAYRLNVRAAPGTQSNNPPVDRLTRGTRVEIYEEQPYAGATWYRIGAARWVHGGWVQVISRLPQTWSVLATPTARFPADVALPMGWVVADALNVRARPGVAADNPPIDQVHRYHRLDILDTHRVDGQRWFQIGADRWVEGSWVGVARARSRPSAIGAGERWVGVNLREQTAVTYLGDRPVYAALAATGMAGTPTVRGIFRTWWRVESRKMSGRGYYLEEVTWTCYFYRSYALHTAYWHDAFGRPRSHGCVNLSPYDAWWIFRWSQAGDTNSPAVYVYWE